MIDIHQPGLGQSIIAGVSSRLDGNMKVTPDGSDQRTTFENRRKFINAVGIDSDVVTLKITYGDTRTYDDIRKVGMEHIGESIPMDAAYTSERGVPLFLPIADCVGIIVYDEQQPFVGVIHSGRHGTLAELSEKFIKQARAESNIDVSGLKVWMSPSVGKESYGMEWFDRSQDRRWLKFVEPRDGLLYIDMAGYIRQQLIEQGIAPGNIMMPVTDTAIDKRYYSHSQGDHGERFAIVAMLK